MSDIVHYIHPTPPVFSPFYLKFMTPSLIIIMYVHLYITFYEDILNCIKTFFHLFKSVEKCKPLC